MFRCAHEPRDGLLWWWTDGDTGEVEWWAPMTECSLCRDGYYLRDEDLAPGGRLADWYEHERELIRKGETIHD